MCYNRPNSETGVILPDRTVDPCDPGENGVTSLVFANYAKGQNYP